MLWQPSLLDDFEPSVSADLGAARRTHLDATSWVDHQPGWVAGSDRLFEQLAEGVDWGQRRRWMYGSEVDEPRLTARWAASSGETLTPPVLEAMRAALSGHYGVEFDSLGLNLYRDGRDSVAWHADRIPAAVTEPMVALVSLGAARTFRLRPLGRPGRSVAFHLGRGDLLVTGGRCQRAWQHSVPKVASAGPRISLAFRHGRGDY